MARTTLRNRSQSVLRRSCNLPPYPTPILAICVRSVLYDLCDMVYDTTEWRGRPGGADRSSSYVGDYHVPSVLSLDSQPQGPAPQAQPVEQRCKARTVSSINPFGGVSLCQAPGTRFGAAAVGVCPSKTVVCESNAMTTLLGRSPHSFRVMSAIPRSRKAILTALYRDTVLLGPRYIGIPPYSDYVISVYRLAQTTLYRDTALLRPPCIGVPPYSDRLISGCRLTQTALDRDTALLRPPYIGIPPYSDRLISEYRLTQTALYRETPTVLYRAPRKRGNKKGRLILQGKYNKPGSRYAGVGVECTFSRIIRNPVAVSMSVSYLGLYTLY